MTFVLSALVDINKLVQFNGLDREPGRPTGSTLLHLTPDELEKFMNIAKSIGQLKMDEITECVGSDGSKLRKRQLEGEAVINPFMSVHSKYIEPKTVNILPNSTNRNSLHPPQNQPRKRSSTASIRDQSDSRKRPSHEQKDNNIAESIGYQADMIGYDEEREIEVRLAMKRITIKNSRQEMEDNGIREKGWLQPDIKVVRRCSRCDCRIERGLKCQKCVKELCVEWCSKTDSEIQ